MKFNYTWLIYATVMLTVLAEGHSKGQRYKTHRDVYSVNHRVKQLQKARQDILIESFGQVHELKPISHQPENSFTDADAEDDVMPGDGLDVETLTNVSSQGARRKRQVRLSAIRGANVWPNNIIPYYIDINTYPSAYSKRRIRMAVSASIRALESRSCVKFIERRQLNSALRARIGHNHAVRVFNGGNKCWSHVGCTQCSRRNRSRPTYQDLSISTKCTTLETVQHELGHVLGLTHEHTRTDMPQHIAVNYSMVNNPTKFYRKTHPEFINKAPYDLSSIQHYRTNALVTHNPADMWLKSGIGKLTHYDEWSINLAYCADGCNQNLCKNDGYMTNKDGRCKCVCVEGLTGATCEEIATVEKYRCGGVIDLSTNRRASIRNPNYPRSYSSQAKCAWLVKAPAGQIIESKITHMSLPSDSSGCKHRIEIHDKLLGQVARGKCGRCSNGECFTSNSVSNSALIILDAMEGGTSGGTVKVDVSLKSDCKRCRGAPCHNGRCMPKDGHMTCNFEQGLLRGCSDLRIHDSYQKSYNDITWTEAAWEVAEKGPKLPNQQAMSSVDGRLHLLSIRPKPFTTGPYEGAFRIVPYLLHPGRSRCLKFKLYSCCDRRVTLRVYTATNGQLSSRPLLSITRHTTRWRNVQVEVRADEHITTPTPTEVVFKSRHSVSSREGQAHLGVDDIQWTSGGCH